MPLLVRNLSLRLHEPEGNLRQHLARVLGVPVRAVRSYGIVRRAIDARRHDDLRRVYHVECAIDGVDEAKLVARGRPGQVTVLEPQRPRELPIGNTPLPGRPVIVGTGPAGLYAALLLAERGYRPLVLERGQDVPHRHRALHLYYTQGTFDPESNLLFGIGGAGTYSDGKLYSRTHDPRNAFVLEELVRFGADPDILINAKPHLGSDKLPGVCRRMVEHIRACGGEVRYGAKVTDLILEDVGGSGGSGGNGGNGGSAGPQPLALRGVTLESGERIEAAVCILAIGHSARDTYRMLRERGVAMAAKPFQMGVRIEHPQAMVNRNQYGDDVDESLLGPADYTLVARNAAAGDGAACGKCGPDLFSFCMCPGGLILPSNESPGEICTNGASNSRRDSPYANSGLVVTVMPEEFGGDPLLGVEYQRRWERLAYELSGSYAVPAQRASDFLTGRVSDEPIATSFPLGAKAVDLRAMLPAVVTRALERGLPMMERMIAGYASAEGVITGPETRASSPVRIVRDEATRQSTSVAGLYPVGEGAGYAGGIVSSAADGLRSAEAILAAFAPPRG